MGKRSEIRIVDATMRDGGLVNDFYFTDEFVKALYETNLKTGVDYMEFGYKASKRMFDPNKFGKWKYCDDEDIRKIVGDNKTNLKIAVMADVGRCDFREDFRPRRESPIDMIRVATYIDTIKEAIEMIEYAADKGYEVSCNIMGISRINEDQLHDAMESLYWSSADVVYLVDSYGALYPENTKALMESVKEDAFFSKKQLGIHAHNNLELAFANTLLAHGYGADWMDGTYASMGRGAGNCAMELLLGYMEQKGEKKYHLEPAIPFIDEYMRGLRDQGVVWGTDLQYLVTGFMNQHPRQAIAFTKEGRTDHDRFYKENTDKPLC